MMMSGQRPDQRWYWDGKKYATDLAGVTAPISVTAANQAVAALIAAPGLPCPCPPIASPRRARCRSAGGKVSVGAGRFARAAGDARAFRATPAFDGMTLALAARLIGEMGLGKGPATDVIAIGLSATDYVGHTLRHGRRGNVPATALARPRPWRFPALARPQRDRLCGRC